MASLLQYITHLGWIAVALVIFAESGLMVGFFLPGDSLLFTAGFLVQQHVFHINILFLFVFLLIAAMLGNSCGYFIGHHVGRRLFNKPDSRFFRHEYLMEAEKFYQKYGSKTIVLAMFVPIVRAFTPVVAGIARMPYRTFVTFNLIGAFLWTGLFLFIGYFAGGILKKAGINIEAAALIIIAISLLPGIIHLLQQPEYRQRLKTKLSRKK